jgi:hypothetical protein
LRGRFWRTTQSQSPRPQRSGRRKEPEIPGANWNNHWKYHLDKTSNTHIKMPIRTLISGIRDLLLRPKGEIKRKQDNKLESDISVDEILSTSSGGLVVIGLIIEIALARLFPAHAPPSPPGTYSAWLETWGSVIANGLVALGVYGEIFFARHVRRAEEELRRRSNEKLAEATERAATALREAEQIKAEAAWRSLDQETVTKLRNALVVGTLASVRFTYLANDPESKNFVDQFCAIFRLAGWRVGFQAASYADPTIFGILIPEEQRLILDEMKDVSRQVKLAFSEAKISFFESWPDSDPYMTTEWGDALIPVANIYIGPKPMPLPR